MGETWAGGRGGFAVEVGRCSGHGGYEAPSGFMIAFPASVLCVADWRRWASEKVGDWQYLLDILTCLLINRHNFSQQLLNSELSFIMHLQSRRSQEKNRPKDISNNRNWVSDQLLLTFQS